MSDMTTKTKRKFLKLDEGGTFRQVPTAESNQSVMRLRLIKLKKLLKEAIAANEACDLATLDVRLLDIGESAWTGEKLVDSKLYKKNRHAVSKYAASQLWTMDSGSEAGTTGKGGF